MGLTDAFQLEIDGELHLVLRVTPFATSRRDGLSGLTNAERIVARLAVAGGSSASIAMLRGTSARTVANQLAAVFRKLGVCSRAELAARLHE